MPAAVTLVTPMVAVEPGGEGVAQLRIRNTGTIVDQFAFNLLGEASAWARCDPPVLSLFPGAEDTVSIRFTPPRSAAVTAGAIAFGVRVTSQEDREFSQVEEGAVQVGGFSAVTVRVVPRTSTGKRHAEHRIEITNTGNASVHANVDVSDPDDILVFKVKPPTIDIAAGATEMLELDVLCREAAKGGMRRRPFTVTASTTAGAVSSTEAAFEQRPRANVLIWIAVLLAAAALVFVLRDQAEGAELLGTLGALVTAATAP